MDGVGSGHAHIYDLSLLNKLLAAAGKEAVKD
jgi:hypothetical protein